MKKMKKLLAVILAISMIAVLFVAMPASAATLTDPQKLAAMNLFRGDTTEGLTPQYLAKTPDRKTAARLLLRFTGLEVASDAYTGTATFKDATTTTHYWQPMIGYLKANPSVGFQGYEDNTFRPNDAMNAQAFYKVLLTILGYKQDTDFTWDQTLAFAASKGLLKIAGKTSLTNADAATAMVEALNANTKAGEKLITKLIEDEVVTSTQASAAGFNVIQTVTGYDAAYTMAYGGTNPLPSTLTAKYADNTTSSVAVVWSSFPTTSEGTYTVTGTVEGFGTITSKVTLTKTLIVTDAYPSSPKEILVTFNMPVPQTTVVTLKSGLSTLSASSYTSTWSTDRKTLIMARTYNFNTGEYSVTVATSTKAFVIGAEKATEISIGANNVYPQSGDQDLNVTIYNQYGTAMNLLPMNLYHTAICLQKPDKLLSVSKAATTIKVSGIQQLAVGDTVTLMIADNATGLVLTKTINVAVAPVISSFSFGTLTIKDNAAQIMVGTSGHKLSVTAIDQYGDLYKLRTGNMDITATPNFSIPLYIHSSDSTVVDASQIVVDSNGDLVFSPGAISASKGGTVTLTVQSLNNQSMPIVTYSITVKEPARIDTVEIIGPAANMRAGQWTKLTAFLRDQDGNYMDMAEINNPTNLAKLTITSSNTAVIPSGDAASSTGIKYDATTKSLMLNGIGAGVSQVYIYYNGVLQANIQFPVEAAAVPTQLKAISIATVFQKTAFADLTLDNFTIWDQYNEVIKMQTGYKISVTGDAGLTISNSDITTSMATTKITAPATTGNYSLTFTLKDSSNEEKSSLTTSIRVVEDAGITSYSMEPITNMYAKASTVVAPRTPQEYYKQIKVTGRTASQEVVQLVYAANGLPALIDLKTTSNTSFIFVEDGGKLYLSTTYTGDAQSINTLIQLFIAGVPVASQTVYASSLASAPTTVTMAYDKLATKVVVTAKDQYGVVVAPPAGVFYSADVTSLTVDPVTGLVEKVGTGPKTAIIRFVSSNGVYAFNVSATID